MKKRSLQKRISTNNKGKRLRLPVFFCSFFLFFYLFSQLFTLFSTPVGWENTLPVTEKDIKCYSYHATSSGIVTVLVIYGSVDGVDGLYTLTSFNGGVTFLEPKLVTTLERFEKQQIINPRIAIAPTGRVTVAWQYFSSNDPQYRIYLAHSDNRGVSWNEPLLFALEREMTVLAFPFYDELSRLHLIYHGYTKNSFVVYHTQEKEGGFTDKNQLSLQSNIIRGAFFPAVVVDKNNFYVVWQGKSSSKQLTDDLYFSMSDNYGEKWKKSKQITYNTSSDSAPSMILKDETLYVVYLNNENVNWKVNLIEGLNRGGVWSSKPLLAYKTNVDCFSPHLFFSNDETLSLLWHQKSTNGSVIMNNTFDLEGKTFTNTLLLSLEKNSVSTYPMALVYTSNVNLYWIENGRVVKRNSDLYAAPPKVVSATHPYGEWSQFENAEITWTTEFDPSGVEGYATIVNGDPYFDPTVMNLDATLHSIKTPFLNDGISYFHIRTVDRAGNYSRTVHFPLLVSSSKLPGPTLTSSTHEEGKESKERNARFTLKSEEEVRIKGYYYSLSEGKADVPEKFIEGKTLSFNNLENGRYFVTVRAVDKADQLGRITTFELVIGKQKQLSAKEYEQIASGVVEKPKAESLSKENTLPSAVLEPRRESSLGNSSAFEYEKQEIILSLLKREDKSNKKIEFAVHFKNRDSNILENEMFTFSLLGGGEELIVGTSSSGLISFENLEEGDYTVIVTGSFVYGDDPQAQLQKSDEKRFDFTYAPKQSVALQPFEIWVHSITEHFAFSWKIYSLLLLSLLFALIISLSFMRLYYVIRAGVGQIIRRIQLIF